MALAEGKGLQGVFVEPCVVRNIRYVGERVFGIHVRIGVEGRLAAVVRIFISVVIKAPVQVEPGLFVDLPAYAQYGTRHLVSVDTVSDRCLILVAGSQILFVISG